MNKTLRELWDEFQDDPWSDECICERDYDRASQIVGAIFVTKFISPSGQIAGYWKHNGNADDWCDHGGVCEWKPHVPAPEKKQMWRVRAIKGNRGNWFSGQGWHETKKEALSIFVGPDHTTAIFEPLYPELEEEEKAYESRV